MSRLDLPDIHPTPQCATVDVAPALAKPLPTDATAARADAMELVQLSKDIDAELAHHQSTLTANAVDLHTPLVDSQGFPLAGKDLMAIRTARNRIVMLHNDSKAVRDRTAKLLELAINGDPAPASTAQAASAGSAPPLQPFARVNSVAPASPAEQAGLLPEDRIVRFADITLAQADALKALARPGVVVDGQSIEIVVLRQSAQPIQLTLTPTSGWGGRGLLGCHLVPL